MLLAIISDIHENFHNLIKTLEDINTRNVEYIICLGDLMNAGIAKVLAMQDIPCFMVWGNNDGEKVDIMQAACRENSQLSVSLNTYDFLELGGKKIFISHYNDLAEPMAKSGLYDAVFYGHNHLMKKEIINNVHVVNPGELAAQKTGICSYAIYNTQENSVELIEIDDIITLKSEVFSQYLRDNQHKLKFRSKDAFQ